MNEKGTWLWKFTIINSPRWCSGVSFWSVLSASRPRGKVLLTALKECTLIMVWNFSSVDIVTAEVVVCAMFLTWGWDHDVEKVLPCPAIHNGIQKALERHCDGLHGEHMYSIIFDTKFLPCVHACARGKQFYSSIVVGTKTVRFKITSNRVVISFKWQKLSSLFSSSLLKAVTSTTNCAFNTFSVVMSINHTNW